MKFTCDSFVWLRPSFCLCLWFLQWKRMLGPQVLLSSVCVNMLFYMQVCYITSQLMKWVLKHLKRQCVICILGNIIQVVKWNHGLQVAAVSLLVLLVCGVEQVMNQNRLRLQLISRIDLKSNYVEAGSQSQIHHPKTAKYNTCVYYLPLFRFLFW